jgi:UDP-N-acetylglucosamine 4,6-dehydratase
MNYKNKTNLITGGTSSFGNRVVQYLAKQNPAKIIIYSRDEKKQYEMKKQNPDYHYVIGDIRDSRHVEYAMSRLNYVFINSALKQITSCKYY